ncbi:lysophospholipase, partial [Staphylococcus pseudintermedius]
MNYIKYISSHDGTQLYTKINTADELFSFGDETINVIIVHGLAEHLDRYDELTDYLVNYDYNVIRYDQRGHG